MSPYSLPDLQYDYGDLAPHVAPRIVELHHDVHHSAYVDKANAALNDLAGARDAGTWDRIVALEKDLAFNLSGHVLHSIYWTNLSPDGGGRPEGELLAAIEESFDTYERFHKHLSAATTGVQGSGWGALAWEPRAGRLVVEQIYDHQANVSQGSEPLLVFDAWEHAFYLQYENDKQSYVEGLWQLCNWRDVEERFETAQSRVLAGV